MFNGGRVGDQERPAELVTGRRTLPFPVHFRRMHSSSRRLRFTLYWLVFAAALFVLAVIGSVVEHAVYSGRVLPGVEIDGARVAGKKDVTAADVLARLAADLDQAPVRTRVGERRFTIPPAQIGFDVDTDATARNAAGDGRHGNLFALVAGTVMRRVRPDHVPLVVRYDGARLDALLESWGREVDQGVVEGGLRFEGTKVVAIAPHTGTGLQRDKGRREIVRALGRADRTHEVVLPFGKVVPLVDQNEVDAAAARARSLLAGNREIRARGARVSLTPAQLAATLGTRITRDALELTVDTNKLRITLGPRIAALERPPTDATFSVSSANVVSVVPSRDGTVLDFESIATDILQGKRVIRANLRKAHPAHDTAWARHLGITKQVSSFTTNHAAGEARVHNIHLAADVLNNTIVESGQMFSLNEKLGPRTPEKGYVRAPILVNDGFGEDYGCGVSQLTTTLFNAVFFGGYRDVEHSPHRFYISRYPMGREATINYPSVDLKFRNDTTHGLLIRTGYSDTSITVTFYGDNDGRTVSEENRKLIHTEPITDDVLTCPVKKPTDDPNNRCAGLTAFERVTALTGETGYDVEFERVIDQPGQPERRQRYQVHYPMLPNKVLVGTTPPTTTTTSVAKVPKKRTTTSTRPHA
jgi:vancomycin resistance protein YoaR